MFFDIFRLAFKKIFKSYFCWLLIVLSTLVFFLINLAFLKLITYKNYNHFDSFKNLWQKPIRTIYVITLFSVLTIVISNLAHFAIDKQNLIFILSKQYNRIACLCEKILALFLFTLFFIGLLIVSTLFLNFLGTKINEGVYNKIWSNDELYKNCCLQIFFCLVYKLLFWPMIDLYFSQRVFKLLSTFSLILCSFLYGSIDLFMEKLLDRKIDAEYSFFIREIFLHNVFYCPISFVGFVLGLSYFDKIDLRI